MFPLVAVLTKTRPDGRQPAAVQPKRVCDRALPAQELPVSHHPEIAGNILAT